MTTPRTDAAILTEPYEVRMLPCEVVPADFSRQLETDLNEMLSPLIQTALVFAARYTHDRNTGGTLAVVRALEQCWRLLDERTREQILRESSDAVYNMDDWQRLRDFAANHSAPPTSAKTT